MLSSYQHLSISPINFLAKQHDSPSTGLALILVFNLKRLFFLHLPTNYSV